MMRACWLALGLVALVAACEREVKTDGVPATRVPTFDAAAGSSETPARGRGISSVLYSEHDAVLRSRVDGVVASVEAELGDRVQEGELLASLEDGRESAEVASATAAAELARAEHGRVAQLAAQDMASKADLDEAVYRLKSAEASLERARVELEYTRIRAPFGGTVAKRYVRLGQRAEEGDPLFRVTALLPLRAQVSVPEMEARTLEPGHTVRVRALDGSYVEGRIARIGAAVDPTSGTVDVLVDVPSPGDLRPGSSVYVELAQEGADEPSGESEADAAARAATPPHGG